ncbi:hypothetical protein FA15DRAFT_493176 [Coprinopsis marcescibilis]|uniref:Uncharacterized protein n=1 Tax=Coprinopsis marcescibilis TaxID=230819 RepID=A0A5C3KRX6_COPMA|nr:hypothetical protein FA15DRAFT_493176 [Coprinopsis marcescibilis]
MLTTNSIARQALCSFRGARTVRPVLPSARSLHASPPVMKRKRVEEVEDLFGEEFEVVDASATPIAAEASMETSSSSTAGRVKRVLNPEEREYRLSRMVEFMKPRLGRKPEVKTPQIRHGTWVECLQMARTKEQLEGIVELLPKWKESGHKFKSGFAESFVQRCQELDASQLALTVFGNYSKYNVSLTLPAARRLLHSLHSKHSIQDLMTASALYAIYDLPPVNQDFVSCAIIVAACLRKNTAHSNVIAEALIPSLRQMKLETRIDKQDTYNRENVWLRSAISEINGTLCTRGKERIGRIKPLKPTSDLQKSNPEEATVTV